MQTEPLAPHPHRPAPDLRHRLRHETAQSHADLDGLMGRFDLGSREDYRRFLEINAAALLPLEAGLAASGVGGLLPDWPRRARSDAIRADLARLGGLARPLEPPQQYRQAVMLGILYVLEGSRLGARYILRSVERSPDAVVTAATGYLRHGDGEPLWPEFVAHLERHAGLADDHAVVAGANHAFDVFLRAARQS